MTDEEQSTIEAGGELVDLGDDDVAIEGPNSA
jgi:hypothetical protein